MVYMFMVGDTSVVDVEKLGNRGRRLGTRGHFFNVAWVKSWFGCFESIFSWKVRNDYVVHLFDMMAPEKWEFKNDVLCQSG